MAVVLTACPGDDDDEDDVVVDVDFEVNDDDDDKFVASQIAAVLTACPGEKLQSVWYFAQPLSVLVQTLDLY